MLFYYGQSAYETWVSKASLQHDYACLTPSLNTVKAAIHITEMNAKPVVADARTSAKIASFTICCPLIYT